MALDQKDLDAIKDIVEFNITASERRLEGIIEDSARNIKGELRKEIAEAKDELKEYIDKQTDDLAEINRAFISKIDNHEKRITKLENRVLDLA